MVRSRRLELHGLPHKRPQRCASTNSATTARGRSGPNRPAACSKRPIAKQARRALYCALVGAPGTTRPQPGRGWRRRAAEAIFCACQPPPSTSRRRLCLATRPPSCRGFPVRRFEWIVAEGLVDYDEAVMRMEARAAAIREATAGEGRLARRTPAALHRRHQRPSFRPADPRAIPVHATGRGGEYTYHGPGQRVAM